MINYDISNLNERKVKLLDIFDNQLCKKNSDTQRMNEWGSIKERLKMPFSTVPTFSSPPMR